MSFVETMKMPPSSTLGCIGLVGEDCGAFWERWTDTPLAARPDSLRVKMRGVLMPKNMFDIYCSFIHIKPLKKKRHPAVRQHQPGG